jgi:hypothetical protein
LNREIPRMRLSADESKVYDIWFRRSFMKFVGNNGTPSAMNTWQAVKHRRNQRPGLSKEPEIAGYDLTAKKGGEATFRKIDPEMIEEWYLLDRTADPKKSYIYRALRAVDTSGKQSDFSKEAEVPPVTS